MPPGGVELYPRCNILRYKDFLRLIKIFAGMGVKKVRITGGEPLVRKGIVSFIRQVRQIDGIEKIAITTNGALLPEFSHSLRKAGVNGVNISLDTLDRKKFTEITGYDELLKVIKGIKAATKAGFDSVKINMVVMKGVNDNEIERFARLTKKMNIQMRFLEFMSATPSAWNEKMFMSADKIRERVSRLGELAPLGKGALSGPAELCKFDGAVGEIGIISAVTKHFCASCNRLRLTSTGGLITCLFDKESADLISLLKIGADDIDIAKTVRRAVKNKNRIRSLPDSSAAEIPERVMRSIGG